MFSMTVITSGTSLWAWLMALAMVAKLSSFVHAPTVDPGLQVSLLEDSIRIEVDLLPIIQLDSELMTPFQIVDKAFVRCLPFGRIGVSGSQYSTMKLVARWAVWSLPQIDQVAPVYQDRFGGIA